MANTQKILKNNGKSGIECFYKNPKSPENTPKIEKNNNLLKTKRILNTKIQAR